MLTAEIHLTEERLEQILTQRHKALRDEFDAKLARLERSLLATPSKVPNDSDSDEVFDDVILGEKVVIPREPSIEAPRPTRPRKGANIEDLGAGGDSRSSDAAVKLDDIMAEVNATESGGRLSQIPTHLPAYRGSVQSLDSIAADADHHDTLQDTVWESAFFFGVQQIGFRGSALLLVCLALNITMQVGFAYVVWSKFPTSPVDMDAVETWRHVFGHHSSQVGYNGYSLVSRLCDFHPTLSVATVQASELENIDIYSGSSEAPFLCIIVIMIWIMMWLKEASRIRGFLHDMWMVPSSTRTDILAVDNDMFKLVSLARSRKFFIFFVSFWRLGVSLTLFIQGTRWLIYTTSITDLVLNGAALAFVFDIDELIYEVAVPNRVKIMSDKLDISKSLHLGSHKIHTASHNFAWKGIVHLLILLVYCGVVLVFYVLPNVRHMEDTIDAFCGGRQDFAVDYQADLDVHFYVKTNTDENLYKSRSTSAWKSVDDLIKERPDALSVSLPDLRVMNHFVQQKASILADEVRQSCKDSSFSDLPAYWRIMLSDLDAPTGASCKELSWACGNPSLPLIRLLCPATCRCHVTQPSTAFSKGCPWINCRYIAYWNTTASCTDPAARYLTSNPHWRSFWHSSNVSTRGSSQRQTEIANYALTFGCSVITEYNLQKEFCAASEGSLMNRHSLDSWCPGSCDCLNNDVWGCGRHCVAPDNRT